MGGDHPLKLVTVPTRREQQGKSGYLCYDPYYREMVVTYAPSEKPED